MSGTAARSAKARIFFGLLPVPIRAHLWRVHQPPCVSAPKGDRLARGYLFPLPGKSGDIKCGNYHLDSATRQLVLGHQESHGDSYGRSHGRNLPPTGQTSPRLVSGGDIFEIQAAMERRRRPLRDACRLCGRAHA